MQQVIHNVRNGEPRVLRVPDPIVRTGHVLIANACSLISAGTEKQMMELARKSLLGKARQRPDQVRRVLEKLRNEGLFKTVQQVTDQLDQPVAMGYSSAGVVLACGAGVQALKPGDRAASNGPHAGVVCVPKHLCAHVPEIVPFEQAAFTVLGAIAMQGVRLSRLSLGESALIIGLGLVGQITAALLRVAGVRVIGTDPDPAKCELGLRMGADVARPALSARDVADLTRGLGADAVLVTASAKSDGPIRLAADAVRKKGRIVAVGLVGLNLDRRPMYFKEAELVVSCSYGPGRYDEAYETRGIDYRAPYVRWTEQRNMQAVLDLMGSGRLDLSPLISHRFPVEEAERAYQLIESGDQPFLGIVLTYPGAEAYKPARRAELKGTPVTGSIGVGCLGAGNFARQTLLPAIGATKGLRLRALCSAGGLSAAHTGDKLGFEVVTADEDEVVADPQVKAVFIVTRHDQHAAQVIKALRAGKHVFVEKPLALTVESLAEIDDVLAGAGPMGPLLMVGFNRRFSPAAHAVRDFFTDVDVPLTVSIRFNAGEVPADHWTQDEKVGGGRIIGEACHAIDLATYLVGAPPVRVFAESIGGPHAPEVTDDQCFITLRHANGSVSSVAYLAGGDRAFPKERVEVIGGGRVAVIDDFRTVTTCARGRRKTRKLSPLGNQDKGHRAEILAFSGAISAGLTAPISWNDLYVVSLASILAVRSLREGVPFDLP